MEIVLRIPVDKETIKAEIAKLRPQIEARKSEIKMLSEAIRHYQNQCDHAGQVTGHNERDGSWGNPCPTCGYGY